MHVETWQTTYRGIIADAFLDGMSYQKHEDRHRRFMQQNGCVYFVAESSAQGLVGFVSGGPERTGDARFPGELYAINILPTHRRQGVGMALVRQWSAALLKANLKSALVWVLVDNAPAVNFYTHLGATLVRQQMIEIGNQSLRELALGWTNLHSLDHSPPITV